MGNSFYFRNDPEIKEISLSIKDAVYSYNPEDMDSSLSDEALLSQGFYNGKILGCSDYSLVDGRFNLECVPINFFDFYRSSKNSPNNIPLVVTVNAVITSGDNVVLIMRGSDVYYYNNSWDCPGGLVPVNDNLRERVINRINDDTGLKPESLVVDEIPGIVLVDMPFLHFYYSASVKDIDSLNRAVKESSGKVFLLNKNSVEEFLSGAKIFPPAAKVLRMVLA